MVGTLAIGRKGGVSSSGRLLSITNKIDRWLGPMCQCLCAKRSSCIMLGHASYWVTHEIGLSTKGHTYHIGHT